MCEEYIWWCNILLTYRKHATKCSMCTLGWFLLGRNRFVSKDSNRLLIHLVSVKNKLQTFKYFGLNLYQMDHVVFMHQKEYIEKIEVAEIDKPNWKDSKLLPHKTQQLWRVAQQLNWVSNQTQPDIVYAASVKGSFIKDVIAIDLITTNKFITLLKSNEVTLPFPQMNDFQSASLVCFSDGSIHVSMSLDSEIPLSSIWMKNISFMKYYIYILDFWKIYTTHKVFWKNSDYVSFDFAVTLFRMGHA